MAQASPPRMLKTSPRTNHLRHAMSSLTEEAADRPAAQGPSPRAAEPQGNRGEASRTRDVGGNRGDSGKHGRGQVVCRATALEVLSPPPQARKKREVRCAARAQLASWQYLATRRRT